MKFVKSPVKCAVWSFRPGSRKKGIIKFLLFFTILLSPLGLCSQHSMTNGELRTFSPNFRLYPGTMNQTEVFIVRSPLDEKVLFSSCNTLNFIPFFISEGVFTSFDGGLTWQGSDTCTGKPIDFHGGDPGITIDRNGTFILTRLGREPFVGLFSHYSADQGRTWSAQKVISTDDLERAVLASDSDPASPFFGRTYAAWVKFAPPYPLMMAYTDNGAQTWSVPKAINNPPNRSAGGDIDIGPGGEVYVCWAGVTDVSPFREVYTGFAISVSGGASWTVTENAFAMNGINGILPEKDSIRVNGLPSIAVDTTHGPHRGWIYIVTGQKNLSPAGSDPDIILNRSTDGGKSWSPGIRVNQDALNNGKIQYFPAIHVDKYGGIDIVFYDDRYTNSDSCGMMLARSLDGGDTWREYLISDRNFKPTPIGGLGQGYQGDNIDLTSSGETLWPVWMDNRTGIYQIWTVPLKFTEISAIGDKEREPPDFELMQNQPNPFHNQTTIGYRLYRSGFVSLQVYDLSGQLVADLIHDKQQPGSYSVRLVIPNSENGSKSAPGVYVYRFRFDGETRCKRLIILN